MCVSLYVAQIPLLSGDSDRPVREINDERTERTKRTQEKARNPAMGYCRLASGQDEC
ncbi:hypothetical protein [Nostoc sp. PCC 7524]|uniref:hypothetical protein n=1 Tax=Nostoc sp. (strain ATCC 29411 / PCC 7524) TaxID=28072 RepID=UPI001F1DE6B6|nr:hypothetical protein [Nostoc sp. PCC 7524]